MAIVITWLDKQHTKGIHFPSIKLLQRLIVLGLIQCMVPLILTSPRGDKHLPRDRPAYYGPASLLLLMQAQNVFSAKEDVILMMYYMVE